MGGASAIWMPLAKRAAEGIIDFHNCMIKARENRPWQS